MAEIKLKYPVEVLGQQITTLNMRRMKVRDRLAADKAGHSDVEKEALVIANLCEVDRKVIEELDAVDYATLQEELNGFFT